MIENSGKFCFGTDEFCYSSIYSYIRWRYLGKIRNLKVIYKKYDELDNVEVVCEIAGEVLKEGILNRKPFLKYRKNN